MVDSEINEIKNKQINELTDMVKMLLEEQRQLKAKLELQELKTRDSAEGGLLNRKPKEITKRASERTRS